MSERTLFRGARVVDPASGQVVRVGVQGELCTRGYSVMLGYWNNDEATRGAIDTPTDITGPTDPNRNSRGREGQGIPARLRSPRPAKRRRSRGWWS